MANAAKSMAIGLLQQIEAAVVPLAEQELSLVEQAGLQALTNLMVQLNKKIASKLPQQPAAN